MRPDLLPEKGRASATELTSGGSVREVSVRMSHDGAPKLRKKESAVHLTDPGSAGDADPQAGAGDGTAA